MTLPTPLARGGGGLPRWLLVPAVVAVIFLAVPLLGIAVRVPWGDVPALLTTRSSLDALGLSLLTCVVATAFSLLIGLPLALVLARSDGRVAGVVRTLVTIPMVLPPVVSGLALLITFGRRGVLGAQPFEIVPAAIIFGGVRFAEIPAFGAVRRLGRGAVSGFGTAMAIAEAHLLRLARRAIGAPAGKTPVIGSFGAAHLAHVAAGARNC